MFCSRNKLGSENGGVRGQGRVAGTFFSQSSTSRLSWAELQLPSGRSKGLGRLLSFVPISVSHPSLLLFSCSIGWRVGGLNHDISTKKSFSSQTDRLYFFVSTQNLPQWLLPTPFPCNYLLKAWGANHTMLGFCRGQKAQKGHVPPLCA